ncbi:tyrosine-type recombinase/integrase [Streptomyces sp. SDT5-1]|uniref:tyrosine-type recombinase/integrase n=1 Tax=Streptomyces sp. SDT5-1 TaxID=3406418 RepID=UPI003FCFA6C9
MSSTPNPTHPPVPLDVAERTWRLVVDEAHHVRASPEEVRLAAVVTLARASGGRARVGELYALTVEDLDVVAGRISVVHRRPGPAAGRTYRQTYALDKDALTVLNRWLAVRERVQYGPIEGDRVRALFVTVRAAHRHGVLYHAGLPIHPRGMQQSWDRLIGRLNARHAGEDGFPLPRRFEQLRRAWR